MYYFRIGPFEVEQDMMDSVEDSNGHSEESDEDMFSFQTDPDTGDWEQVPDNISIPPQQLASIQQPAGYVSQDMTDSSLTASASSVISSAYSTFASYFRR